jgi:hypothetical protein
VAREGYKEQPGIIFVADHESNSTAPTQVVSAINEKFIIFMADHESNSTAPTQTASDRTGFGTVWWMILGGVLGTAGDSVAFHTRFDCA